MVNINLTRSVVFISWDNCSPTCSQPKDTVLTLNTQVSAEERFTHVDIFDLNLYVVHLSFRLLSAVEFCSRSEIRRRANWNRLLQLEPIGRVPTALASTYPFIGIVEADEARALRIIVTTVGFAVVALLPIRGDVRHGETICRRLWGSTMQTFELPWFNIAEVGWRGSCSGRTRPWSWRHGSCS